METKKLWGKDDAEETRSSLENAQLYSERNGQRHFTQNTKIAMKRGENEIK